MSIQFPGTNSYNYVKNPAMREDTGGLADDWDLGGSKTGAVVPTIVGDAGFNWQRLQYTGVAGDAGGKTIDLVAYGSEVATFAAGDPAAAQFLVKGAVAGAGISVYLGIIVTDASDVFLAAYFEQFTPAGGAVVISKSQVLPALASKVTVFLRIMGIANGDTVDISMTKAMTEKTNAVNAFWDGNTASCSWSGPADASASVKDASAGYAANLTYPAPTDVTLAGGTLAYIFAPGEPMTAATPNAYHVFLGANYTMAWSSNRQFVFSIGNSGATPTQLIGQAVDRVRGVDHLVVCRWDEKTADLCVDGLHAAEMERTDVQGGAALSALQLAGLGAIPFAQRFGLLLLSPERKTKEWVDALYAAWLADPAERVAIFQGMMGDGDRISVFEGTSTLCLKKNTPPLFPRSGRALAAFDGNSMTYGIGATRGLDDYPTVCTALLPGQWAMVNQGVAGLNTSGCIAGAAAGIDPTWNAGYRRSVCVFWEGTNSLNSSRTIAEELALWRTYCDARRAAGFEKIVVLTVLPTTDAAREANAIANGYSGWEQMRLAFNTLLKANYSDFADRCLDIGAHAIMGDVAHCSDGVYYGDAIHPAPAGYAIIAGLVAAVIKDVLR